MTTASGNRSTPMTIFYEERRFDPYIGPLLYGPISSQVSRKSYTMTRSSTTTPGFWGNRNSKYLPMNAFKFTCEDISGPVGTQVIHNVGTQTAQVWNGRPTQGFSSYPTISDADKSSVDARARTDVRLKMKDQKVNLVQAFAEREQTVKLIGSTAVNIANSLRALKRGDFVGAANALGVEPRKRAKRRFDRTQGQSQFKRLTSGWLGLQYGWKPLLNDIYGSAEAIAASQLREMRTKVQSAKKLEVTESRTVFTAGNTPLPCLVQAKAEYTVKYVVYYATADNMAHTTSALGITNPALIAWELLPWSFVIDWFLPMGNYISSWDATVGLSFLKGSVTTFEKQYTSIFAKGTNYKSGVGGQIIDLSGEKTLVTCTRVALAAFPEVAAPGFKNPASFSHAANAIALLSQLRK